MTETGYSPIDTFERALRGWPVLFGLMVLGALVGLGIHRVNPGVYEAFSVISTSIDYVRTGALTEVEQDNAIGIAGDIIQSPAVFERLPLRLAAEGVRLAPEELRAVAQAERQNNNWMLRIRHSTPQTAALIANAWADTAGEVLSESLEHAQTLDGLQRYQDSLVSCLESSVVVDPVSTNCNLEKLAEIQSELEAVSVSIAEQKTASRGILPALGYEISQYAAVPDRPSRYGTNSLVLAGTVVGFLLGLALIETGLVSRLRFRRVSG